MSLDNDQPPKLKFSEIKKSLTEDFNPSRITKSLPKLPKKLFRGWGMLLRFLLIGSIGYFGYQWIQEGRSAIDTLFVQLTLHDIIRAVLKVGIPLACLGWFFSFPDNDPEDKDNSYYLWAAGGCFLIGILIIVRFWLSR